MTELPIEPPIHVRAGPGRALNSIGEAIEFVRQWTGKRAGPDWPEVLALLEATQTPEQVPSATAALKMRAPLRTILNENPLGVPNLTMTSPMSTMRKVLAIVVISPAGEMKARA